MSRDRSSTPQHFLHRGVEVWKISLDNLLQCWHAILRFRPRVLSPDCPSQTALDILMLAEKLQRPGNDSGGCFMAC